MSVPVDNPRNKSPIIIIDKLEDCIKNNDKPALTNKIVSILIRVVLLANLVTVKADNIPIIIGIVANALENLNPYLLHV